jgi:ABC-type glycerol-3-phosphate transport system substrate-binding protein
MRRFALFVAFALSVLGLSACGGGGSSSTSSGGGSAVTQSNITLPNSVQVVSAH